ncbi:hypothetical protein Lal_00025893 [Lupinus albus]|nr:hypothetical protein Lal_00025893 [Lupinus albus]
MHAASPSKRDYFEATTLPLRQTHHLAWSLRWRRNLFSWEEEDLDELIRHINDSLPKQHTDDSWIWIHNKSGQYNVRNAYQTLHKVEACGALAFFKKLWDCNIPTKMKCLVWKIALDDVPSKVNLTHRGGLSAQDNITCSLCGELEESPSHLFFSYSLSHAVWQKLYSCFGLTSIIHNDVKTLFSFHENAISLDDKKQHWWVAHLAH